MKKAFILLATIFFQFVAYGQAVKGISAGITPFGHLGVRNVSEKTELLSSSYSFSSPAFHLSYDTRRTVIEATTDLFYSKEKLSDETGLLNMDVHHFGVYRFQGYTILPTKRIQIPIYLGIGLSYFTQAIPTKLFLDFGGRARLRVYVTNRLAIFGGGYYILGFSGSKTAKYMTHRYGVESGLLFNF